VISSLLLAFESFYFALDDFTSYTTNDDLGTALKEDWIAFLLVIYSALVGLFLFVLLFVQFLLISYGITTCEFLKDNWNGLINPYNEGFFANWASFLKSDFQKKNCFIGIHCIYIK